MPDNDKKETTSNANKNTKPIGQIKNLNTTTKGLFEYKNDKKEKY